MEKAKPVRVRKVGGSWYLRLPPDFVRNNNLTAEDFVIVDITKFKILRDEDFGLLGREQEAETEGVA